jgi:hypothetical protein
MEEDNRSRAIFVSKLAINNASIVSSVGWEHAVLVSGRFAPRPLMRAATYQAAEHEHGTENSTADAAICPRRSGNPSNEVGIKDPQ